MLQYVALLRGINVGGHKNVAMADLIQLCTRLGLKNTRSFLNTGNLIFQAEKKSERARELLLEEEVKKRLSLETVFCIRDAREWQAVIAGNPLREEARRDPSHLLVLFLKSPVNATSVKALQAAIKGPEIVRGKGRQVYIAYPDGIGRSRLTPSLIESKLGTRGTGRNWNTVLKIGAMTASPERNDAH